MNENHIEKDVYRMAWKKVEAFKESEDEEHRTDKKERESER